ncbi:MAG TPA: DsbA family protein [Candidatus Dormibacteraeota bacterium]|nr:DsbA family protein [Candidatus Dormibacteraeota bacterium]
MEHIRFHFDPICPWAWVTSRWAQRLVELGELEVTWAFFALAEQNRTLLTDPEHRQLATAPLQLLALARQRQGNVAVGRLYTAIGEARHLRGEPIGEPAVLEACLQAAGLDPTWVAESARDATCWEAVLIDHRAAVERCAAFGVPTLILDGGAGPGAFGPVITDVPDDAEAVALLRDTVRWIRRPYLYELKRERGDIRPVLGDAQSPAAS